MGRGGVKFGLVLTTEDRDPRLGPSLCLLPRRDRRAGALEKFQISLRSSPFLLEQRILHHGPPPPNTLRPKEQQQRCKE